jgi:crossover junction endodeoxyribonuclease RuvC
MIIGIDPGKSGGIAAYCDGKIAVNPMPDSVAGKRDLIVGMLNTAPDGHVLLDIRYKNCICYIEDVHAMPGQGVTSMFNFGYGLGELYGILSVLDIPVVAVTPQAWHKVVYGTGVKTVDWKGYAIEQARMLYPEAVDLYMKDHPRSKKYPDGMAEALMIMRYGLLKERDMERG